MHTLQLVTLISLTCTCALCAVICSAAASRCAPLRKALRAAVREIGDLTSEIDALGEAHKRLRSREGMRDLRAARAAARAPDAAVVSKRETKAEARARIFGGTAGPAFAKRQLDIARAAAQDGSPLDAEASR